MAGNKPAKMGHLRQTKKVTYICPSCGDDLELRKTLPNNVMNLMCKKATQLDRSQEKGWEVNHQNFSDDCGFSISFNEKGKLETR